MNHLIRIRPGTFILEQNDLAPEQIITRMSIMTEADVWMSEDGQPLAYMFTYNGRSWSVGASFVELIVLSAT